MGLHWEQHEHEQCELHNLLVADLKLQRDTNLHRNNPQKMASRGAALGQINLWALRLVVTSEPAAGCSGSGLFRHLSTVVPYRRELPVGNLGLPLVLRMSILAAGFQFSANRQTKILVFSRISWLGV